MNYRDMKIMNPEKLSLAMLPTPLCKLERTSSQFGAKLWTKRDDMTGSIVSGNKIRKLEFLFADAVENDADTIITCGGEQSNHCRATAAIARRLGMGIHLVLRRTAEGASGNLLLDIVLGASMRWVTPKEYEHRNEIMAEEAEVFRSKGKKPYIIPEGGSNPLGIWGYFLAAYETIEQAKKMDFIPDYAVVPSGSGGTYAGLWLGFRAAGMKTKIVGITAGPDTEGQRDHIEKIAAKFREKYKPELKLDNSEITLIDGFWGKGYGVIDEEIARFIMEFAMREGLILDPTYTGKAFRGAMEMLKKSELPKDKNIILWHTGGIYGIFTKGQYFRELHFSGERVK